MPTIEDRELQHAAAQLARRLLAAAEEAVEMIEHAARGKRRKGFRNDNQRMACVLLARLVHPARPRRETAREQREAEYDEEKRRRFGATTDRFIKRMEAIHDEAVKQGVSPDDLRIRAWRRLQKGLYPFGDSDLPCSEYIDQQRGA
ncbi:MAG: hypothetical protein ABIP55_04075 [Tepidisphaeraceae bacterium]